MIDKILQLLLCLCYLDVRVAVRIMRPLTCKAKGISKAKGLVFLPRLPRPFSPRNYERNAVILNERSGVPLLCIAEVRD